MPRHPENSKMVAQISGSLYSKLIDQMSHFQGEIYHFHVGDTWMEPAPGCRVEDLRCEDHVGLHRYAPPIGLPSLRTALAKKVKGRTGVATDSENILVGAGATGALSSVVGALIDPGDEVMVLAPYWPLINGIIRTFQGTPVPVPLLCGQIDQQGLIPLLESHRSSRTAAIYVSTPNNPTGRTLPRPWLESLVKWASEQGLWIHSDEVYEDYCYVGTHVAVRPMAMSRCISIHSFSKAYGMAGNRCGYVVAPPEVIEKSARVGTHTFYSTPTVGQIAGLRAMELADDWISNAKLEYKKIGDWVAQRLSLPPPQGSTFFFIDVAPRLDHRGLAGFLEDCAGRGLFVSPGTSFGPYPTHIRLCYTAAPPEVVKRGVEVLAKLLDEKKRV